MEVLVFLYYVELVWSMEVLEVKFVLLFGVRVPHTSSTCARHEKK